MHNIVIIILYPYSSLFAIIISKYIGHPLAIEVTYVCRPIPNLYYNIRLMSVLCVCVYMYVGVYTVCL